MAPSSQRSRHNIEQRLAPRFLKRSSPLQRDTASVLPTEAATPFPSFESTVTLSATPSSTSPASGPPGVTLPPHGVSALIGVIVVLSLAIFGFSAWRLWVYRRDKKVAQTAPSEKSSKPVGLYDAVEDSRSKRSLSAGDVDVIAFPLKVGSKAPNTRERTPAEIAINLGYRPKVVYAVYEDTTTLSSGIKVAPPPPGIKATPPLTVIKATPPPPGLQITPPPVYVSVPPPVLSPRTAASIAPTGKTVPRSSFKRHRLVVVESTYTPSLDDELEVREGETLQLLEEYEDEWCLVQRVGQKTPERGVVPRFCVVEKRKSGI